MILLYRRLLYGEYHIYDHTFKALFSRPEIIRNFLTGFLDDMEFINDVDFDRIETPATSFITDTF